MILKLELFQFEDYLLVYLNLRLLEATAPDVHA